MLTPDGRLKVLDFGLAKLRYDADEGDRTTKETQSVTQDGRIVGTVAYMSPEQAQGLPVDHRSDIFALGILLYEMATGERPFRGNTNLSVLSSILKDTPRPASELRDDVPKPLARMIQRALEKRPEDRYQSASDLRRDLEDLKRDVDSGELLLGTTAGRRRLVAARRRARAALGAARSRSAPRSSSWRRWPALFFRGQPPATAEDGRRSLAVFYFDNLTGDPQLDWLRTGLTDMLVTNLSQSPGLRVLGTQPPLPAARRDRPPRRPHDLGPGRGRGVAQGAGHDRPRRQLRARGLADPDPGDPAGPEERRGHRLRAGRGRRRGRPLRAWSTS